MLSKISPEALSRATHIRVHFGDGQWGYAVSEYAMHSMPTDFLVREVTSHLAESIGNQLAHAKQAGGRTQ